MQLLLIALVIAGGMGLSVEAGLLGPLCGGGGGFWGGFSIFGGGRGVA
ncbi:EamA-like transporter family protein, partial [Cronobacter malonaticus]